MGRSEDETISRAHGVRSYYYRQVTATHRMLHTGWRWLKERMTDVPWSDVARGQDSLEPMAGAPSTACSPNILIHYERLEPLQDDEL